MLGAIVALSSCGFLGALLLYISSKKFYVETSPLIESVENLLPGLNCGGCGYPGCRQLAEAIVKGDEPPSACPVGGNELAKEISKLLGVEFVSESPKVARVKCGGDYDKCKSKYDYIGPESCKTQDLLAKGDKMCSYGCLGRGDCVRACTFDAIHIGLSGLPIVDEKKCTACGLCVKACPRNLIELVGIDKKYFIACNSNDKGAFVRKVCSVGCIGCGRCVKECPEKAIILENNLATILQEKCNNCGKCYEVCPTKSVVTYDKVLS
ncbi:MAG: RnfABCDGE type electron transport complex subunit B [Deferribacterota bacterium]|nr:RnfABCDGE type electron transport complex subunit B [Deferribacterota bacterium]